LITGKLGPVRQHIKLTFVAALVASVVLGWGYPPQKKRGKSMADIPASAIEKIRPSVVQIGYKPKLPGGGRAWGTAGTGFIVSQEGYVVTNNHVLQGTSDQPSKNGATDIPFSVLLSVPDYQSPEITVRASFVQVAFDIADVDASHDIALLKLKPNPFKEKVEFAVTNELKLPTHIDVAGLQSEMPREGIAVLFSGYPLRSPIMVTQEGIVASRRFPVIERRIPGAPPGFSFTKIVDALLVNALVNPGNSGGPVYLQDSAMVVGICRGDLGSPVRWENGDPVSVQHGNRSEVLAQNKGLAIVIPIKYTIDLLEKHHIPWRSNWAK
jgi:S1-C subfamily serine protease